MAGEAPLEPVIITSRDIYTELREVGKKVDNLTLVHSGSAERLVDHETRLRMLERLKYTVPASALTALISAVVAVQQARGQ